MKFDMLETGANSFKLYVLASLLFAYRQPEWVVKVIEEGESKGIAPRKNLLELKAHILREGNLPRYFSLSV